MIALLALLIAGRADAADPLTLGDPDGVSVRPGLLLDTRALSSVDDEPSLQLQLQRVRPMLRGTLLGPEATYTLQAELAGESARVLDAFVDLRPEPWLAVRAGRFLVPFSRSQLTPVPRLQFQGFANSADTERHDRDVGLQVAATPLGGRLDARVGVFQGPTADLDEARPLAFGHVSFDVLGRVPLDETAAAVDPEGPNGLAIGAGGSVGTDTRPRDLAVLDTTAAGLDLAARYGPGRVQAEMFARTWDDGASDLGGYVQASVSPLPRFEVAGRLDALRTEVDTWTMQGLASWYLQSDSLRLSLEYTRQQTDDAPPSNLIGLQQQLWF